MHRIAPTAVIGHESGSSMKHDPEIHHRRSQRLAGYDYRQNGAYFVTLCTHARECLFGDVVDGTMELSPLGDIVLDGWLWTPVVRPDVSLDAYVIMPNHLHGIIVLHRHGQYLGDVDLRPGSPPAGPMSGSLGAIINQVKSTSARRINRLRGLTGAPVWQRDYHDHIVRNESDLDRIRAYIEDNPARWRDDRNRGS